MKPEQFKPANNYILTYLCERPELKDADGQPLVILPDAIKAYSNWAEIVDIGPKCKWITRDMIGCLVVLPEFSNGLVSMRPVFEEEGWWLVRDDAIAQFVYREP